MIIWLTNINQPKVVGGPVLCCYVGQKLKTLGTSGLKDVHKSTRFAKHLSYSVIVF